MKKDFSSSLFPITHANTGVCVLRNVWNGNAQQPIWKNHRREILAIGFEIEGRRGKEREGERGREREREGERGREGKRGREKNRETVRERDMEGEGE